MLHPRSRPRPGQLLKNRSDSYGSQPWHDGSTRGETKARRESVDLAVEVRADSRRGHVVVQHASLRISGVSVTLGKPCLGLEQAIFAETGRSPGVLRLGWRK